MLKGLKRIKNVVQVEGEAEGIKKKAGWKVGC